MHRSNWGQKSNQQRTLSVHISRTGWDKALSLSVLTHPEPAVYKNPNGWETDFRKAVVHIQWDTERSFGGAGLAHYSIQVGIGRQLIREFVEKIEDLSPAVAKMRTFIRSGNRKNAKRLLPPERVYPVDPIVGKRIHMDV